MLLLFFIFLKIIEKLLKRSVQNWMSTNIKLGTKRERKMQNEISHISCVTLLNAIEQNETVEVKDHHRPATK